MPDNEPRPSLDKPWENGWTPDTSRAPGTRRLWLAGALAVATVVACVTAIALNKNPADETSANGTSGESTADTKSGPGLISFASPSATPGDQPKKPPASPGSPSPTPHASASPTPSAPPSKQPSPTEPTPAAPAEPSTPATDSYRRSVRSVNYPDRYWHMSGGLVKLDRLGGSEFREDATFTVVPGLADSSCFSFTTSDGAYLRHRSFVLRADRHDGSALFAKDATFCSRPSRHSGAVMLESMNYPGRFLRHENFQLKLAPYQRSDLYLADSAFRFVTALDG